VVPKQVAIVGLGALGSVFAALLARASIPVLGICRRREHREAIQKSGLVLQEGTAELRVQFPVMEQLPEREALQLIIVLVKAFDTESIAKGLAGRIDGHTPVLTLQNGLGNAEVLAEHLQPSQVLAGTTTMGALREVPGLVRLTGRGECEIGAWHGTGQRHLSQVQALFHQAGVACHPSVNLSTTLWKKVAVNAAINPITAILRVRNGELLDRKELEPVVGMAMEEVWRVAARHRIAVPTPPELHDEVRRICRATAANQSSMLCDVLAGRRTEIDAINGAVARLGQERGVTAPVNATLTALVQSLTLAPGAPESERMEK
jgi:2-dehydropantoate 2-reductase